jgi:hypothetical protein
VTALAVTALAACGNDVERQEPTSGTPVAACDASPYCDGGVAIPAREAGAASNAGDGASPREGTDGGAHADAGARAPCCDPFVDRLAHLDEDWPQLLEGYESRSFSSYDRTGGNSDGFVRAHSVLYDRDGEHVIFDAYGPGVLDTLWFTGPDEGGANLDLGTVRFYLDDEPAPRLSLPWNELFTGDRAPFLAPLVADNSVSTGGYVSFVPVPYAARLIVTTSERPSFYQAHYETLPPDTAVKSFEPELNVESARARFASALAAVPSSNLEEVPLDGRFDGAGTLEVLRFEPDGQPDDAVLGTARIRITWDDQAAPAVDVPLGAFFGSGLGMANVRALPLSMDAGAFESRFAMPFWSNAHWTVTGIAGTLSMRRGPSRYERGTAGYFHATYSEAAPTVPGEHFTWLDIEGAGCLAGTSLTVHPSSPQAKKWWEGDLHSSADGLRTPAIEGTGHEDDQLGGWSNTFLSTPFTLPLNGEPRADMLDRSGQYNADSTMYRFYPGLRFSGGLRHAVEHGDRDTVLADYAGVAYYYLDADGARLAESDVLDVSEDSSRAAHDYAVTNESAPALLTSNFDGPWNTDALTRTVTRHQGVATFRLTAPSDNQGCHLRRLFDQSTERQGARVRVDGDVVGTFYAAEVNASRQWAERDFFLPSRYTRGKTSLVVRIEPLAGGPSWSVAEYRLLCSTR